MTPGTRSKRPPRASRRKQTAASRPRRSQRGWSSTSGTAAIGASAPKASPASPLTKPSARSSCITAKCMHMRTTARSSACSETAPSTISAPRAPPRERRAGSRRQLADALHCTRRMHTRRDLPENSARCPGRALPGGVKRATSPWGRATKGARLLPGRGQALEAQNGGSLHRRHAGA